MLGAKLSKLLDTIALIIITYSLVFWVVVFITVLVFTTIKKLGL